MSTPMILAVLWTSLTIPPLSSSNFSIILPKIRSPAAPSPSPPKISNLGGPHSNTFPVLHSTGSALSILDPNILNDPTFFSNSVAPSCTF